MRRRSRSLAHELVEGIGAQIQGQALKPGDKLPTESAIMQAYGVSRTVVREALSRLQAGGLVETRHGIGTFVLEPRPGQGFGIDAADIATAVDVHGGAGTAHQPGDRVGGPGRAAAQRGAAAGNASRPGRVRGQRVGGAGDAVAPDFRFHLAIANATGNRYFADIMSHLGATLIPRTRINSPRVPQEDLRAVPAPRQPRA